MPKKEIIEFFVLYLILLLENSFPFFTINKNRWQHIANNIGMKFFNLLCFYILFFLGVNFIFKGNISQGILGKLDFQFWTECIIALFLYDFCMYLVHLLDHQVPFLWKFHRVHHTDKSLDCSTAFRTHIVSILIMSSIQVFIVLPIIGVSMKQLFFIQIILYSMPIIHHGNFCIPPRLENILNKIFVTPNFHRIHHSNQYLEMNSNYGVVFSFWDRFFKTFTMKKNINEIEYGINEFNDIKWQSIKGMLITPFVK